MNAQAMNGTSSLPLISNVIGRDIEAEITETHDVLIVGAGPTGLLMAYMLSQLGGEYLFREALLPEED